MVKVKSGDSGKGGKTGETYTISGFNHYNHYNHLYQLYHFSLIPLLNREYFYPFTILLPKEERKWND